MSKYSIEESTLTGIADAVRDLRYENDPLTPAEIEAKIRDSEIGLDLDICVGEDEPWVRPDDWPNLDEIEMDDDFDGVYLTYDLRKTPGYGWIGISCYTALKPADAIYIERGHLENNVFVVDESHYVAHQAAFRQPLDEANGLVQLWRVRSDSHIQRFYFRSSSGNSAQSISYNVQPCVEATGKLPYIIYIASDSSSSSVSYCGYATLWMERDSRACGGKGVCTYLYQVWYEAANLRSLDVSKWDTTSWKVSNIGGLLNRCYRLTSVDLTSWDTSNWVIANMGSLFYNDYSLRFIDISNWNTSNWIVTSLNSAFSGCYCLKEINLNSWNTTNWKVSNIANMFSYCYSLVSIDISDWDTSNWAVTVMSEMFRDCNSLICVDMSDWDTSNWAVTKFTNLFYGCNSLKEIDISRWDTSNWAVDSLNNVFLNCRKVESINLNNWDTSNWKVAAINSAFSGCYSLKELYVGNWNTSDWVVTDINNMCYACRSLEIFDFNNWDTSKWAVTNIGGLFSTCYALKHINLTNWDTHNWPLVNMRSMFEGCRGLIKIDISGWDDSNFNLAANTFGYLFTSLVNVESIKGFENWDLSIVTSVSMPDGRCLIECTGIPLHINHSYASCVNLTRESLVDILTALPIVTGKTITLSDTNKHKLTPEEIAIATNKGWTVA